VLENGQASEYAGFFDIDWTPIKAKLHGKVLLPVLGNPYGAVLDNAELQLRFDAEHGEFVIYYYEHHFPVDPAQYPQILAHRIESLSTQLGQDNPLLMEYQSLVTAFRNLPPVMRTRLNVSLNADATRKCTNGILPVSLPNLPTSPYFWKKIYNSSTARQGNHPVLICSTT